MAKKQTRRSISVSRATYDRLKAFCESSGISMSQFVENRVGDVLSHDPQTPPAAPRPVAQVAAPAPQPAPSVAPVVAAAPAPAPVAVAPRAAAVEPPSPRPVAAPAPITSAAARIAVEPPPPVIKPKSEQPAPKPAEKRPDQIFTF